MSVENCNDAINNNMKKQEAPNVDLQEAMNKSVQQAYTSGACKGFEVSVEYNSITGEGNIVVEEPAATPKRQAPEEARPQKNGGIQL